MAIYKRDIVDINLESGNIHRTFLAHTIGYKDQKADHFGVRVFRDGEAVSLTGVSVQGVFMPPQGSPIAITSGNIVSGNTAEVVLPQACYDYNGQFCLAIKLVDSSNSVTGTVRIVDGVVDNTHASGTVAPTSAVPTYQEVLSAYEQAIAVIGSSVRFDTTQSLTTAQKTTARGNIDAASTDDVSALMSAIDKYNKVYNGITLGNGAIDKEKTIALCVEYIYKVGTLTLTDPRICAVLDNSSNTKRIDIIADGSGRLTTVYNSQTGENVYESGNNKIVVKFNWAYYGGSNPNLNVTYANSHIHVLFDNAYNKIIDAETDIDGLHGDISSINGEIDDIWDDYSAIKDKLDEYNKTFVGITTDGSAIEKEKIIASCVEYIYFVGTIELTDPRICAVLDNTSYTKKIDLIASGSPRYVATYNSQTGENVCEISSGDKIVIKFNWNYFNGDDPNLNVTYDNSHIHVLFDNAYDKIINAEADIEKIESIVGQLQKVFVGIKTGSGASEKEIIIASCVEYAYTIGNLLLTDPKICAVLDNTSYPKKIDVIASNSGRLATTYNSETGENVYESSGSKIVIKFNWEYYNGANPNLNVTYANSHIYLLLDNAYGEIKNIEESLSQIGNGAESYAKPRMNIVCAGSSITWGNGSLDGSMVGVLDNIIRDEMADTLMYSDMDYTGGTVKSNNLFHNGKALLLTGVGNSIEFDIFGDELAVCHAKRRSNDFAIIKVLADGVEIGRFDNKNPILSEEESFTGEDLSEIILAHPYTFNHQIYINGSSSALENVVINTGGYGGTMPEDADAWVFRKSVGTGEENHHAISFADSLGLITSVRVVYNYGRIIAYERSSLGQLTSNEYSNESVYGAGSVSYDPANPTTGCSSGMEFRCVDERAFFVHKFESVKKRHIKLEIVSGTNPYMLINFATNRYHNIMNAGIGGWKLSLLTESNVGVNKYGQFYKCFHPQIIFCEFMTNDDWSYEARRINRSIGEVSLSDLKKMHWLEMNTVTYNSSTQKYAVTVPTGIISSITPVSLVSSDIIGTETAIGDIVRIGNYHGDIHQVICRKITSVDLTTGTIGWKEPIFAEQMLNIDKISDLVGAEINIRNLSAYKDLYELLVTEVHDISPETMIIVVQNGLPNYWTRQLWGYEVIHEEVCKGKPFMKYLDARDYLYRSEFDNITGVRSETVTNTGASEYELDFDGNGKAAWAGFKVLVDGIDVYGKDAYVEINESYYLKDNLSGADCNKASTYARANTEDKKIGKMKLVFTRNVPTSGQSIVVQFADKIWSNDFTHPSDYGALAYGRAYASALDN